MANFRDGSLIQGQAMTALTKTVLLTADNTGVSVDLETMLLIGSDNTTATNRTFTLTPSTVGAGHTLRLEFNTAGSTKAQLVDTGTMKLNGDWLPVQYDTLTLISDGTNWVELGRSYVGQTTTTALTDAHIFVGNGTNLATDVAVTGDVTITNLGVTAIASDIIVNADVKTDAAIAYSKLATLTSGNILVGSAGNVATSVAMAGDVTIVAAGTTAIGANKVLESMVVGSSAAGLNMLRVAHGVFDPSGVAGDRTIAPHTLGATLPDNAIVLCAWYEVLTTCTSATDAGTIAISIQGANDVVSAIAISDVSNPWDAAALPIEGIPKIETTATWLKTTAARAMTATVAVEALTAGLVHVWCLYLVSV
jgi:hypothetical protein